MKKHIETLSAKEVKDPVLNPPHVLPIYASASFVFDEAETSIAVFNKEQPGFTYGRYGNPTVDAVAHKIALLEQADDANPTQGLLTSSGQSAVATVCMARLSAGDAILTQGDLYGGTTELFHKILQPLGIEIISGNLNDLDWVKTQFSTHAHIKMLYVETPANPTLSCYNLTALAQVAKAAGAISMADNTFATPYNTQPLGLGFDYVIHSTTKFLNGHGNMIGGAIVGLQSDEHWNRVWQTLKLAGGTSAPFDAWLLHNGLKTFALRMRSHNENAMALALYLQAHPKVAYVNYPGLGSHGTHAIAKQQMTRGFGGMLSFEVLGGYEAALKTMNALQLCTQAPTLGDVDTLLLHPASSSHLNVAVAQRLAYGITDGLIRVSVGIEHIEDLKADFDQALG